MTDDAAGVGRERVSVVITTIGRVELRRAVLKAMEQSAPPVEIVVVNDNTTISVADLLLDLPTQIPVRIVQGAGAGANAARNRGIAESTGDFVALLDDDDWWYPEKLEAQLEALRKASQPELTVVTSQCFREDLAQVVPLTPYRGGSVGRYLFCRRFRQLRPHAQIQTSSLLYSRKLGELVPFDPTLVAHQDWDWLLKVEHVPGSQVVCVEQSLYCYSHAGGPTLSATSKWSSEQQWALRTLPPRSIELYGYFMTIAVWRSLTSHNFTAYRTAVYRAHRYGRFHLPTAVAGLAYSLTGFLRWGMSKRMRSDGGRAQAPTSAAGVTETQTGADT